MYTIGQVSEMLQIPTSTLRYYDKEGLFPNLKRISGIRQFSDKELNDLRIIRCLKKSGMEIRQIKQFMQWCTEGRASYPKRKALFENQKRHMEEEMERMNQILNMLKYKCWYYEQAIRDGNEERLSTITPKDMPEDIREAYLHSYCTHS